MYPRARKRPQADSSRPPPPPDQVRLERLFKRLHVKRPHIFAIFLRKQIVAEFHFAARTLCNLVRICQTDLHQGGKFADIKNADLAQLLAGDRIMRRLHAGNQRRGNVKVRIGICPPRRFGMVVRGGGLSRQRGQHRSENRRKTTKQPDFCHISSFLRPQSLSGQLVSGPISSQKTVPPSPS